MATGTTVAPDSSASRPMPGRARSLSLPVRDRPPSQYMATVPPRSRIAVRGHERLLVAEAAAHREDAAVRVDPLHRTLEELRLGHEPHLAPRRHAEEEVVHEREVVRREDDRPAGRHLLGRDAAGAEERPRVERREHAHDLVDPVGLARARALVVARRSTPRGAGPCRPAPSSERAARARAPARTRQDATRVYPAHAARHARRLRASVRRARRARRRPSSARTARARATARATRSCVHTPAPTPASSAAPSAVVSRDLGDDDRHAQHVGLELHEPAVGRRAAVGLELAQLAPGRLLHRPDRRRASGRRSPRASRARGARARCRASARRSSRARTGSQCGEPSPVSAGTK